MTLKEYIKVLKRSEKEFGDAELYDKVDGKEVVSLEIVVPVVSMKKTVAIILNTNAGE